MVVVGNLNIINLLDMECIIMQNKTNTTLFDDTLQNAGVTKAEYLKAASDLMGVNFNAANAVVDYNVTNSAIAELQKKYTDLKASDKEGYKIVTQALSEVRTLRTGVEKKRKEYKADSLEYGRKIDSEAERVTNLLLSIETPLKTEKENYDNKQARIKAEQERLERERITGIIDRIDRIKNAPFKHQSKNAKELAAVITLYNDTIINELFNYGEFTEQANNAKTLTTERLNEMLAQKIEAEVLAEERRKFEEEKAALAAQKLPIEAWPSLSKEEAINLINISEELLHNKLVLEGHIKNEPFQPRLPVQESKEFIEYDAQKDEVKACSPGAQIAKLGEGDHIIQFPAITYPSTVQQTKAFTTLQSLTNGKNFVEKHGIKAHSNFLNTDESEKPSYGALIDIIEIILPKMTCVTEEDYQFFTQVKTILKSAKGD